MTRKFPALFTVLALLCFSCNDGNNQRTNSNDIAYLERQLSNSDSAIAPPELKSEEFNTEEYDAIVENSFQSPFQHPYSTFSIALAG